MSILQNLALQKPLKVFVLSPLLETTDEHIDYYYDFTQSINEYTKVFSQLNMAWQWQPVSMNDFKTTIATIAKTSFYQPIVLNLCDGDEVNGTPGVSVIKELEKHGIIYTGANEYFYNVTTSKIAMKHQFDAHGVATPKWAALHEHTVLNEAIFTQLGQTIICKPAVSGGSMGVSANSVVTNVEDLKRQVNEIYKGHNGWNLSIDGAIAEAFIAGREFTTLVTGNFNEEVKVYAAAERVFHESLPVNEQFLSFERLWEFYETEAAMPNNDYFYNYAPVSNDIQIQLEALTIKAYKAVKGTSYGRLDFRMDASGKLYVLEVNAQCGLSEDEDYTSIGAILRFSKISFTQLINDIVQNALCQTVQSLK
jgi:D-alanine-D-alanine ligase